jgi:hypothetical protein
MYFNNISNDKFYKIRIQYNNIHVYTMEDLMRREREMRRQQEGGSVRLASAWARASPSVVFIIQLSQQLRLPLGPKFLIVRQVLESGVNYRAERRSSSVFMARAFRYMRWYFWTAHPYMTHFPPRLAKMDTLVE